MTSSTSIPTPKLTPSPTVRPRGRVWSALLQAVFGTALIFGLLPVAQMLAAGLRNPPGIDSTSPPASPPPVVDPWEIPPPPADPQPEPPEPEEPPPPRPLIETLTGILDGVGGLPILPAVPIFNRYEIDDRDLIFSTVELDEVPRLRQGAAPPYPEAWRRAGLHGEVVVLLTVDPEGRVRTAVVESESSPGAAAGVLDTVRRWRFSPGVRHGQPVSFRLRQSFRFSD